MWRTASADPRATRGIAGLILAACLAILAVAAYIKPDARGYGSHSQLGVAECSFPATLGIPCPTCGMTTAFAHTVRGHWLTALEVQPVGWLLCLATMAAAGLSVSVIITGRTWHLNWYRATPLKVTLFVAGLLLAAWAYTIARMIAAGPAG